MAEIKRYLYNGLSFKINTGVVPIVVNNTVIKSKQSAPQVVWDIDFGEISMGLKNAIEETIFLEPNNTFITSFVGPNFYIGKRVNPVGDVAEYYLTYLFEYDYYGTFVNRPLSYVVDGSDHLIEGVIRIPIAQVEATPNVVFEGATALPRKLFYLGSDLDVKHNYSNVFGFSSKFTEIAPPLVYTGMYIVGESDASYYTSC